MSYSFYYQLILSAIEKSGRSSREVSLSAVGHESAIRNLKKGQDLRISTIERLCKELGLEFYIGPPRQDKKLIKTENGGDHITYQAMDALRNAAEVLRKATQVIEHRVAEPQAHYDTTRQVEVVELAAAAGDGSTVLDENVTGHLAFQRSWLERHKLDPTQCVVIGVRGESMEPTLPDGCSILVNRARRKRLTGHIYLLRTDDGIVVKRLDRGEDGKWRLQSDHPSWPSALWSDTCEIIGEVRWMARELGQSY